MLVIARALSKDLMLKLVRELEIASFWGNYSALKAHVINIILICHALYQFNLSFNCYGQALFWVIFCFRKSFVWATVGNTFMSFSLGGMAFWIPEFATFSQRVQGIDAQITR